MVLARIALVRVPANAATPPPHVQKECVRYDSAPRTEDVSEVRRLLLGREPRPLRGARNGR
jgi:hypothetical protein